MRPISYSVSRTVPAHAIQSIRCSVGWDEESEAVWRSSLKQARAVVSAWDGDRLVGICFLAGLELTGLVTDFTVDRAYQGQGIGEEIIRRIQQAGAGMRNIFLIYDQKEGWLCRYYEKLGFAPVESGMWYRPALEA